MKKESIKHNQSSSLWNYTLSPGWTDQEVDGLKKALMKFGIGRWRKIIESECLPGKSIGQIYLQTQRLMGQQSLGEFMGLHVNIEKVFIDNSKKINVTRKNNTIVNTGDNPTREERARKIAENQAKYGLDEATWKSIKLPKRNKSKYKNVIMLEEIESNKFSTIEKIHHIMELQKLVQYKLELIEKFGNGYFKDIPRPSAQSTRISSTQSSHKKKIGKAKKRKSRHYDYSSEDEFSGNESEGEESDTYSYSSALKPVSVSIVLKRIANDKFEVKDIKFDSKSIDN